jgi:hypothetical protein
VFLFVVPKPEAPQKCVGIIASAAVRRQRLQVFCVAPAEYHLLGFKRGDQLLHGFRDVTSPFVYAQTVQTALPDVVLVGVPLPRQMPELHRLDNAARDHRRPQARSQTQKKHFPSPIAPQSLHCGVIDQLHRPSEGRFEIESRPTTPQVVRFRDWNIAEHRSRVTDRHDVISPVAGNLFYAGYHSPGDQSGAGVEFPRLGLTADQDFHVTATYVDG